MNKTIMKRGRKMLMAFLLMGLPVTMMAQANYDLMKPFGFATRTSRTDKSDAAEYNLTGGGCYAYPLPEDFNGKVIVLTSDGESDMTRVAQDAIRDNDVIIFDGGGDSKEFLFYTTANINCCENKTILGINGAILRTKWMLTDEIRKKLDEAKVHKLSTAAGTGGTLSNGKVVKEEAEFKVRQLIIDITGDEKENFRHAGVFSFDSCKNVIVRNINFRGPGSVDISGADLISMMQSTNMWVDHCDLQDGSDGNFDITQSSDFITVSWCKFSYTKNSYMHQNTNLIGASDKEKRGFLNVTYANNNWAKGCNQRMPMIRVGLVHLLNNYYSCSGNAASINPRKNSEVYIEGNYFDSGVRKVFSENDAVAWEWLPTNYILSQEVKVPESYGEVKIPYSYKAQSAGSAKKNGKWCGATLPWGDKITKK